MTPDIIIKTLYNSVYVITEAAINHDDDNEAASIKFVMTMTRKM